MRAFSCGGKSDLATAPDPASVCAPKQRAACGGHRMEVAEHDEQSLLTIAECPWRAGDLVTCSESIEGTEEAGRSFATP